MKILITPLSGPDCGPESATTTGLGLGLARPPWAPARPPSGPAACAAAVWPAASAAVGARAASPLLGATRSKAAEGFRWRQ